jgi:penicillin amidase
MRVISRLLVLSVVVVLAGAAAAWLALRASLPALDGSRVLRGLHGAVAVERDDIGVVTLRGGSRLDLARATGYVHGQDRFFQMDLARRRAAGELSALFGPVALDVDRGNRLHRFRHRAGAVLAMAEQADRVLLAAYAEGVNAGLDSLETRPWEYLVLRADPAPWQAEDSLLVLYSMYLELNDSRGDREAALEVLDRSLPPAMVGFISPRGTDWDAPLEGESYHVPDIPGPELFAVDRDSLSPPAIHAPAQRSGDEALPGSNNWAVAASASADGSAMVANDMHLGLRVPNTFYRLRLELEGPEAMAVTGASLPGAPLVVVGSNGRVAWGFTNSYGDWTDVVLLEVDPDDPSSYRTPGGWNSIQCVDESIPVAGAGPSVETVCETIWGPVLPAREGTGPRALKWLAHEDQAVNLGLMLMERAVDVDEAVAVANRAGVPPLNMVVADAGGRIAWTIAGRIPLRDGYDADRPASWSSAGTGWTGWLAPDDYPRIVDPPSGRVWTANARVTDGDDLEILGDGGYALGARAAQIRNDLERSDAMTVADMLAIQLDDRALFYQRWRDLALAVLSDYATNRDPRRREFRRLLEDWIPRASTDSVGFRLVYEFRRQVLEMVFEGLTGPVRLEVPGFSLDESSRYGVGRQFEGPAWALLTHRPQHLLNPGFETWEELLVTAVDRVAAQVSETGPLAEETWGAANVASIRHPLSRILGPLAPWLDMPAQPLDGATHMPRVQQPAFGASERFAVSPGREQEGYFHMPGGQSGHPLSPYYRAGHEAWVRGEPTPFLPGPPVHRLTLLPGGG